MSRWFRHYAGMMRDEKLVRVALRSGQSIERVIWVWGAILESAAEINSSGRFDLDAAESAYFLRADEADIRAIEASLADCGRISEGCVVKWSDRQFRSDISTERVNRYRSKQKSSNNSEHEQGRAEPDRFNNEAETELKRFRNPPELETDTHTEAEKEERTREGALSPADDWPSDFRDRFWTKYPNKVGKPDALKKLERVRKTGIRWAELWGGLERYVGKTDDRPWCNPATWIHQQRWTDQPANGASNGRHHGSPQADKSTSAAAGRLLEKIRSFDAPLDQN